MRCSGLFKQSSLAGTENALPIKKRPNLLFLSSKRPTWHPCKAFSTSVPCRVQVSSCFDATGRKRIVLNPFQPTGPFLAPNYNYFICIINILYYKVVNFIVLFVEREVCFSRWCEFCIAIMLRSLKLKNTQENLWKMTKKNCFAVRMEWVEKLCPNSSTHLTLRTSWELET